MPIPMIAGLAAKAGKVFSKVGNVGKKFFGSIGGAFKNKSRIRAATDFFKEVHEVMKGPMGGISSLIEALGILDPMFKVMASVIKIFTGAFLITMMPLFMEWIEIIADPEYQEAVRALGDAFARILIPFLRTVVNLMKEVDWAEWTKFWNAMADWGDAGMPSAQTLFWLEFLRQLEIQFASFFASMEYLGVVLKPVSDYLDKLAFDFSELLSTFINLDRVMIGTSLVPAFQSLYNIIKAVLIPLDAFTGFINQIKTLASNLPSIGGGFGGRGGGRDGGAGGFIKRGVKKAKKYLGLQGGVDYMPTDAWRFIHKGESVKPAAENLMMSGQLETMINLQEESNNRQERMFKFMRYGV